MKKLIRNTKGQFTSKRAKRIKTTLALLSVGYLGLSGAYVAHNLSDIVQTERVAHAEEAVQVKQVLDNFTEDQILNYLANEAAESDYVQSRVGLAEEMFITEKVNGDLDRMKLKVQSGLLFPEEYLGQRANEAEERRQAELTQ